MPPVQVSSLKSGLTVASIENHAPVTTLGVVIKVDYMAVIFTIYDYQCALFLRIIIGIISISKLVHDLYNLPGRRDPVTKTTATLACLTP